tara:strand:+ start:2149 stop:3237 length:1089 start_codon:yes stop_codon:yes gene_type:complete
MDTDSSDNEENKQNVKRSFWKEEEEKLLEEWADKAQCYQWMHLKAHEKYRKKNTWFTIPVIILSTITGTANFAQDRFGEEHKDLVVMSIGSLNIIAGVITTISQYLKIAELNESHRVASLSWGKFYRNVKTELTKHPLDRMGPFEMLKICKEEYDRLLEISPLIPKKITEQFNRVFKKVTDVIRPEIIETLRPTKAFELTKKERKKLEVMFLKQFEENKEDILSKKKLLEDEFLNNIAPSVDEEKLKETKAISERINKFRNTFFQLNGRYPTQKEIQEKLDTIYEDNLGSSITNMFGNLKDQLFSNISSAEDNSDGVTNLLNNVTDAIMEPPNIRISIDRNNDDTSFDDTSFNNTSFNESSV